MITVSLHRDGQPCFNCGYTAFALTVNVLYRRGERTFRVNRVHPCNCLLGVEDVTELLSRVDELHRRELQVTR